MKNFIERLEIKKSLHERNNTPFSNGYKYALEIAISIYNDLHLEIAKPKAKEYFINVYEFKDGRKYFEGVGDMERAPFKYNDRTFFKTIKFSI